MVQQINAQTLRQLIQAESIEDVNSDELERYFREGLNPEFLPSNDYAVDPRDGTRVIFNLARARRPHDYLDRERDEKPAESESECPICKGQTTKIIDCTELSEGFTFINKNLFPIFFPSSEAVSPVASQGRSMVDDQQPGISGFHFLQWTSSIHHHDWHNMPLEDRVVVLERLGALEKKLMETMDGYVSIIKNYGRLVGGSLTHPHQQIAVSPILPNRQRQNQDYFDAHGETFSAYMQRENPSELEIRDYRTAVLLIPYFMRRPFDMLLLLKDTSKAHLFLLDREELSAVADGWRDAIRIMLGVLQRIGRDPAYNVITHNGPGAGLSFEFLPYSQEMGGFEQLGLYICQGNPHQAAGEARAAIDLQE